MNSRPGVKTSEFWITLVAMGVSALVEVTGLNLDPEALATIWGPPMAYIISRGLGKRGGNS